MPVSGKLDLILQATLLHAGHDRGVNAEPDDGGRTEVAVVPGLAYAWSRNLSVYGQLELPVYQKVRGIQLTHDYAASIGLSLALNQARRPGYPAWPGTTGTPFATSPHCARWRNA